MAKPLYNEFVVALLNFAMDIGLPRIDKSTLLVYAAESGANDETEYFNGRD